MSDDLNFKILAEEFEEQKKNVRFPIVVNTLIALFTIVFIPQSPVFWYTIASALFLILFRYTYKWHDSVVNFLVLFIYLMIFLAEMIFQGMPVSDVGPEKENSKGVFVDLLMFILPYIYVGLRLLVAIPLLRILTLSVKLSRKIN